MNLWAALALGLWAVLAVASIAVWAGRPGTTGPATRRPRVLIAILAVEVGLTGLVAGFSARSGPVEAPWSWAAVGVGATAAVMTGGAVVLAVFGLVDASSPSTTARVQRTILRGGAWIGAMERLAMLATILANWPEGILGVVTIKAFARYPELKTSQGSGATERFIIGSFASLGWAAACAGIVMILL
jgi:hypothetical protein